MNGRPPSPQTTLVILLGASEWPKWTDLDLSNPKVLENSVKGLESYFRDDKKFCLPKDNLLNLFNSEDDIVEQSQSIKKFLSRQISSLQAIENSATHLIIYYLGHGDEISGDFYLAIRDSQEKNRRASSLNPKSLQEIIEEHARSLHCFILIDCCYAKNIESAFDDVPINGVSILLSSSSLTTSYASSDKEYTMFSGALLKVLQRGNSEGPEWFSLRMLKNEIQKVILQQYPNNAVTPQVQSPTQTEIDIADIPLFPNASRLPPKGVELFEQKNDVVQCYVIESSVEKNLSENEPLGSQVKSALLKYEEQLTNIIGAKISTDPISININRIVASIAGLENAIKALCKAEIAVFDVTNYEPAIMMLLGIRSVVRRGVTIASAGGDYVVGNPINYPFSIKEVNIISHSSEQLKRDDPIDLIGEKIIAGFEQLYYLPDYLDLPVFDAIRTLPPNRDKRVPRSYKEQVLVLCSFSRRYTEHNWDKFVKRQLGVYIPQTRIIRTLDMKSPRLVSQSLYSEIRLTQMCIVDWTEWRPNVFFELGVRLSAIDIDPVCIIEKSNMDLFQNLTELVPLEKKRSKISSILRDKDLKSTENNHDTYTDDDIESFVHADYQCRRLLELFCPINYRTPKPGQILPKDKQVFQAMVEYFESLIEISNPLHTSPGNLSPGFTYQIVSRHIDVSMEASDLPVVDELIRASNMLNDPEISTAGRSPLLYPSNSILIDKAKTKALERRLAAWFYINNRLNAQIKEDRDLRQKCIDLGNLLARALRRSSEKSEQELAKQIRQRIKELES